MSSFAPALLRADLVSRRGFWEYFAKPRTKESADSHKTDSDGADPDHQNRNRPEKRHAPQHKSK